MSTLEPNIEAALKALTDAYVLQMMEDHGLSLEVAEVRAAKYESEIRSTIESLTERAEEAEREFDRLRQERYDALDARTTEGMSAAEWQLRTGTAERRAREAEAENATLRAAAERVVEAATALVYVCTDNDKEVCEGYHDAHQGCDKCQMKRLADALAARGSDDTRECGKSRTDAGCQYCDDFGVDTCYLAARGGDE